LGAPVFDAGRRAFPIFQKANGIGTVAWTAMDPPLRETMLVRGDVDAITGFTFTSLLNIEARGVKAEDVVVMQYPDFGVKLYGNAIIATPKILRENPEAVKAFLRAFTKGAKDVIASPAKGDRVGQGPRRHHQHRTRNAPPQAGHRHRDQQPRCAQRRLWPNPRTAFGPDGVASVRCLQHQVTRQPRCDLERQLFAQRQRPRHPA